MAECSVVPEDASLNICIYNPTTDPYLTQMYENFKKGVDKENLFIVIMPSLKELNAFFSRIIPIQRARTKTAQFVTTTMDLQMLLMQLGSGLLPKLNLILPAEPVSKSVFAYWPRIR